MSEEKSESPRSGRGAFPRKGVRVFGLGLQDFIKYFFGGNAGLALVVLVLICVFLAIEAVWFFPQHHHAYRIYRRAGQEFVDLMGAEVGAHSRLGSRVNIAFLAEVNESSRREDRLLNALLQVRVAVENRTGRVGERLENLREDIEDLPDEIEDAEDEAEASALKADLERALRREGEWAPKWRVAASAALEDPAVWKLEGNSIYLSEEEREKIAEAVLMAGPGLDVEHPWFARVREASGEKKRVARESLKDFKTAVDELRGAVRPLREIHDQLREVGMENRRILDKHDTAPARRKALLAGAEATEDPAEKQRKLEMADAVIVEEPDYASLNAPMYAAVGRHEEVIALLRASVADAWGKLPEPKALATKAARKKLRAARSDFEKFESTVATSSARIPEWRHDKPMPVSKTVLAFFFGKEWVTNSSWHEFFGLLPLLMGSLCISVVAMAVSVPFSVAAAIYVNQLARRREQSFIKPTLEFIQAIPSIVLGFFGILVLGTALRELSQIEWLSWVPGFPMAERLNILNAGLLLAFMAVPTIFTLAEDALDNVPRAFSEASFALGASRSQTIFRVVVPSALSGIIAAVLLGFGRIIGETMVVLLVAGNKIQIPDFTAGIGVVTQPAHTMTGIIAQELGEVDRGSLHWRALFMVGMVLFVISLIINFAAQRILKKFQQAH